MLTLEFANVADILNTKVIESLPDSQVHLNLTLVSTVGDMDKNIRIVYKNWRLKQPFSRRFHQNLMLFT